MLDVYKVTFTCSNGYVGRCAVMADSSELALKAAKRECARRGYDVVNMEVE